VPALASDHDAKGLGFNGVKVFSATMLADREGLGDKVTNWLAARPECRLVDIIVSQSSDASFHCVAITVFYYEPPRAR
jgi:hypothetical protein